MAGLEDLDAHQPSMTVETLLSLVTGTERDALLRALTDRPAYEYRWTSKRLAQRLQDEGYPVPKWRIDNWRAANVPR